MNDFYKKTIKSIFLGLISAFLIGAFAGCSSDDDGDKKKGYDSNVTDCLPGQEC